MWSIYANIEDSNWIAVASGYTLPTEAAADVDNVRVKWPMANAFMIGMEVWKLEITTA